MRGQEVGRSDTRMSHGALDPPPLHLAAPIELKGEHHQRKL
jgi:hypothetical protein